MGVEGDLPPAKRRRTVTQQDIDRSNATVQLFMGGRQNRWMHGWAQTTNADERTSGSMDQARSNSGQVVPSTPREPPREPSEGAGDAPATTHASRPAPAAPSRSPMQQERAESRRSGQVQQPHPLPRHPSGSAPALVQYESPQVETMHHSAAPLATDNAIAGRKSLEHSSRTPGQLGLPSPAPSDENTYSPIFAEGVLPAQHRQQPAAAYGRVSSFSGTRSAHTHASFASPAATDSPQQLSNVQLLHSYNPSPILPQTNQAPVTHAPGFQPVSYHPAATPHHQSRPPTAHPQHTHASPHPRPGPAHRGCAQRSLQPAGSSSQAPAYGPGPPPPSVVPCMPTQESQLPRAPRENLLRWLDAKQLEHAGTLSSIEQGRLALLRQAVERNDAFYLTLSQLFCLRTVSPSLLPISIKNLPNQCYDSLTTMLGANNGIRLDLITFFAEFPEPIIHIYSDPSGIREAYETIVHDIIVFLSRLSDRGPHLLEKYKKMRGVPLVQDLVEMFNLNSPILQTTYVRFIARQVFVGQQQDCGLEAIEEVHLIDQAMYYDYGHRRNHAEKIEARLTFYRVYETWVQHIRNAATRSHTTFVAPSSATAFFRQWPPSQLAWHTSQVARQQQEQPQQADQRLQTYRAQQASLQHVFQAQSPRRQSGGPVSRGQPPWNGQHSTWSSATAGAHQAMQPAVQDNTSRLLFPTSQDLLNVSQPSHPDPTRSALHQAHLRSPILEPVDTKAGAARLYRHVVGFVLPPTKIMRGVPSQKIVFNISKQIIERRPTTEVPKDLGGTPNHSITAESLTLRLRCTMLPPKGFTSESSWTTTDTYWPDDAYFECNGTRLEPRRKLHFGRYLPVDVTMQVDADENYLKVFINSHRGKKSANYVVAIEVVGVMTHEALLEQTTKITSEASLNSIKQALATSDSRNDEIAVTSGNVTINLADPYTACKIFDIPARGSACLHKDCFDLETFLSLCKRQHPGWPTVVDCWRCPICRGDVRPQTLVIDGFLQDVREELAKQGLLDTRAIVVEADGSWKPKEQERTGVRSPSLEREEAGGLLPVPSTLASTKKPINVVIELD